MGKVSGFAVLAWAAFIVFALCGCGGGGGSGTPGYNASFAPVTFSTNDSKDSGNLTITPQNGFSATVNISLNLNPTEPPGFQKIPSSVTVTLASSSVSVSQATNVPINFTWTSWPVGQYEAQANVTSGSIQQLVTIEVTVSQTPSSATAVTTWHNDPARTGAYSAETILTTANVASATFGKLFMQKTNGPIEAEPLYVPNLTIPGRGVHNVVYIATMNSVIYAFDADSNAGSNSVPLWSTNIGPAAPPGTGGGGDSYYQGTPSTPVIDLASKTLYAVSKTEVNGIVSFYLHALDLATGAEKLGGPVVVSGTVTGTLGGVGGQVIFQPLLQYQRCGLLLLNGTLYVAAGGMNGDTPPDRGWIFGFNQNTLRQTCVYTTAPDAGVGSQTADAGASIWMSGAGPATDGTYLYVATGNGDFDANTGGKDYGDSVLKLLPSGSTLQVADYFTPYNQAHLSDADLDLGSGGVTLASSGGVPLIIELSKASVVFALKPSNMGKFNATADQAFQEVQYPGHGFWCSAVYFNGNLYWASERGPLTGYRLTSAGISPTPFATTSATFTEASPTISYNGASANPASTAIVWAVSSGADGAVLHAFNSTDLTELYNSGTTRDQAGGYMKFGVPCVANGKVYVPCTDGVYVYGSGTFGPTARKTLGTRASRPHPVRGFDQR